jgi:halocyanin-like protein
MLVSYEAPCSDTSNPQWDPAQADQQVVFDTATATTQSDGSLTVHVPPQAVTRVNSYLQNAPNYTEGDITDRTGQSSVKVELGDGTGSNIFEPPAIRIDTGTTVNWEWLGGFHNVVAEDGTFDSGDAVFGSGNSYQYTFTTPDEHPYFCEPHKSQGMKGYVIVEN